MYGNPRGEGTFNITLDSHIDDMAAYNQHVENVVVLFNYEEGFFTHLLVDGSHNNAIQITSGPCYNILIDYVATTAPTSNPLPIFANSRVSQIDVHYFDTNKTRMVGILVSVETFNYYGTEPGEYNILNEYHHFGSIGGPHKNTWQSSTNN